MYRQPSNTDVEAGCGGGSDEAACVSIGWRHGLRLAVPSRTRLREVGHPAEYGTANESRLTSHTYIAAISMVKLVVHDIKLLRAYPSFPGRRAVRSTPVRVRWRGRRWLSAPTVVYTLPSSSYQNVRSFAPVVFDPARPAPALDSCPASFRVVKHRERGEEGKGDACGGAEAGREGLGVCKQIYGTSW